MEDIMLLIFGVLLSVIGIVNMMGNISTVHSYNRKRIKEKDVPKYGRAIGLGTLVIGVGAVSDFALVKLGFEALAPYVLGGAVLIGLILLVYAQIKYNKGFF